MIKRLVEFARLLRQSGVRISMAETLDAAEVLRHAPVVERPAFKASLRTTLVKSHEDIPAFDEAFERFFLVQVGDDAEELDDPSGETEGPPDGHPDLDESSDDGEQDIRRFQDEQGEAMAGDGEGEPADGDESEDLEGDLERMLARVQVGEQPSEAVTEPGTRPNQQAEDVDLYQELPPGDVENLYEAVEELARNLVTRKSLRFRKSRHGRVDIKKTIQRSFRTGNLPFHIIYRHRKIKKNELVVLCDVSGSVWEVARFFIKLVHEMQNQFSRARSFLFVDRINEVTDEFDRRPFEEIVENLKDDHALNFFGLSDFGRAFYQFHDEHLLSLSGNTVLVILGDARTNWFDPQDWVLGELKNRVHQTIWLNPEPVQYWDTDDSVMSRYSPHCDHVLECRNLAQLQEIGELILRA